MDDATRWEHLRAVADDHVRALFYDMNERLVELEADKRLRQLVITVAVGVAPLLALVAGAMSGVKVSF